MDVKISRKTLISILVVSLLTPFASAQNVRVDVAKRQNRIPRICEGVVPASFEAPLDVTSLIKEAACKGAGDMLVDYTYTMTDLSRRKEKEGKIREESTVYEVFIPTLKTGMRARGILLVTSRNGVPVPPEELEKERQKTADRLEKEEAKIARTEAPLPAANSDSIKGMLPLGMYASASIKREAFGIRRGGARIAIETFLATCDFTPLKRIQQDGRDVLVLQFTPRANVKFEDNEKYIAEVTGAIWIDVTDRIVTRLAGWPLGRVTDPLTTLDPPAVYADLIKVREGIWLPHATRVNGLDYPKLFDHITNESAWSHSNYIRFSTEIKDVNVNPPVKP